VPSPRTSSIHDSDNAQISQKFLKQLSLQVVNHRMPPVVATEVCKILIACTHRFRKVRETAVCARHP
jgi:phosphatidylinositol 4-kinase